MAVEKFWALLSWLESLMVFALDRHLDIWASDLKDSSFDSKVYHQL